jgi:hypothetical protein
VFPRKRVEELFAETFGDQQPICDLQRNVGLISELIGRDRRHLEHIGIGDVSISMRKALFRSTATLEAIGAAVARTDV